MLEHLYVIASIQRVIGGAVLFLSHVPGGVVKALCAPDPDQVFSWETSANGTGQAGH